jgi:RHS repeat-associated protein
MVIFDYHEDELRMPLGDHLNTIRDMVAHDGTDWTIVNHVTIDSFGRRTAESDDTIEVFHGLGGRPYDEETGLQNHHHRWYSVDTGRWMSEDPIGFAGGHANLNVYVGNSPIARVDSFGLFPFEPEPEPGPGIQVPVYQTRDGFRPGYAPMDVVLQTIVVPNLSDRGPVFDYAPPILMDIVIPTTPKIPLSPIESIVDSFISPFDYLAGGLADLVGWDDIAEQLYEDGYRHSPIGQLDDSPTQQSIVQGALIVSGSALATAAGLAAASAVGLTNIGTVPIWPSVFGGGSAAATSTASATLPYGGPAGALSMREGLRLAIQFARQIGDGRSAVRGAKLLETLEADILKHYPGLF